MSLTFIKTEIDISILLMRLWKPREVNQAL